MHFKNLLFLLVVTLFYRCSNEAEVDILIQRANRALDEAMEKIIQEGLMC